MRIISFGRHATAFTLVTILTLIAGQPAAAAEVTVDFEDLTDLPNTFTRTGRLDIREFGDPAYGNVRVSGGQALALTLPQPDANGNTTNNVYGTSSRRRCSGCTFAVALKFFSFENPDGTGAQVPLPLDEVTFTIINPHNSNRQYNLLPNGMTSTQMRVAGYDRIGQGRTRIIGPRETLQVTRSAADLGVSGITALRIVDIILADFYVDDLKFDDGSQSVNNSVVSFRAFIPGDNAPAAPDVSCVARPEKTSDGKSAAPKVFRGVTASVDSAKKQKLFVAGDGGDPDSHRVFQSVSVVPDGNADADGLEDGSETNGAATMYLFAEDGLANYEITSLAWDDLSADKTNDCRWFHEAFVPQDDAMQVTVRRIGETSVEARFTGSVITPLGGKMGKDKTDKGKPAKGKGAIDWDLTVTIDVEGNWTVSGTHDGFPAYEVVIDGAVVYESTPGNGPYTFKADVRKLRGAMDVRADASGTLQ